ncbi:MAG TPA: trypsin-like peptidase domain-containing protein [Gaiellaceae bacterium]|nr:trypsin-like peptidase domain-containing protein [Gaiellaceae bacterium]
MAGRLRLLYAAGLVTAAVLGSALALGGAALLGGFDGDTTTTVREVQPFSGAAPSFPVNEARGKALTVNEIYRRAAPGVVQVTATQVVTSPRVDPFFGYPFPSQQQAEALGSGFVIDKAGHIVTNYHVVKGARSVDVSFSNNESMKAKIVGTDPSTDVAVLQVDAHSRALTPLSLGNSDLVHVGDSVVAIGNPFGYDRTVTAGIVSALQRVIQAPNSYSIDHVIQTDAALNKGNSGGPLLNANGNVIGVNSQISTGNSGSSGNVGVGFAVPINTVTTVAAQIIKSGRVEHAFLGIAAQPVTGSAAKLFRLPVSHGLLVARVQPGSRAAKAGLRAGTQNATLAGETYPLGGDLLASIDGAQLYSVDQLRDVIGSKKPGDDVKLRVYRGDRQRTVTVTLGRQPSTGS